MYYIYMYILYMYMLYVCIYTCHIAMSMAVLPPKIKQDIWLCVAQIFPHLWTTQISDKMVKSAYFSH